jgi:hypothetical protein
VPPVSIGDQAGCDGDAQVINKSYIRQGNHTEVYVIENVYHRKQSIIKDESGIHECHHIFKCGMLHLLEKHTDSPDVQNEAD